MMLPSRVATRYGADGRRTLRCLTGVAPSETLVTTTVKPAKKHGLPVAIHQMLNRLKQVYTRDEILTLCRPVFEKEYMLHRLQREGYRMACCSNSIRETLELMIRQSGIESCFEFLVSNEDVRKPKPDPEIYLTAMARLGVPPANVVIVEDAPHGIEAARRSGAHVCQVSGFGEVDYFRVRAAIDRAEASETRRVA